MEDNLILYLIFLDNRREILLHLMRMHTTHNMEIDIWLLAIDYLPLTHEFPNPCHYPIESMPWMDLCDTDKM